MRLGGSYSSGQCHLQHPLHDSLGWCRATGCFSLLGLGGLLVWGLWVLNQAGPVTQDSSSPSVAPGLPTASRQMSTRSCVRSLALSCPLSRADKGLCPVRPTPWPGPRVQSVRRMNAWHEPSGSVAEDGPATQWVERQHPWPEKDGTLAQGSQGAGSALLLLGSLASWPLGGNQGPSWRRLT